MEDSDAAEVELIGREGMIGLPVLLVADYDDIEAMVQGPGTALRMNGQAFREALEGIPPCAAFCSAMPWSIIGRWCRWRPATGATTSTSASPAGC